MDIGIDLGTTFSVIAVPGRVELSEGYPEGEYLEECDVTIIPSPDGNLTFPSVVWEDPDAPGELVVGMEAKQAAERGASPIMWSKREIGTNVLLPLNERSLTAEAVAAEILRHLKQCAERALGQPVRRAVVTHPAHFDRSQVDETRKAAQAAGLDVMLPEQLLMEPVAAALAYVRSDKKDPLRVLIYDLGGGTFDVTCLERRGGVISMLGFDGDRLLGGSNFDRALKDWVLRRLKDKGHQIPYDKNDSRDRGWLAQLLDVVEQAKEALARTRTKKQAVELRCNFLVDSEGRRVQVRERITQEEFVDLIRDYLIHTIECSRRCLEKAGLSEHDLDYLLLVGGSTYGPWVEETVREAFGVEPRQFRPDLCVAAGAAIQSELLPALVDGSAGLEVELDVPSTTPLLNVMVAGWLRAPQGSSSESFSVLLHCPEGKRLGPCAVSASGGFALDDVQLLDEGTTPLVLEVIDANGTPHLEHSFTVQYAPTTAEVNFVSTVLPKPLYIQTAEGMIPLAEEGKALPSNEISVELKRLFGGDSLPIEIYQEYEHAGTIEIKDIPEQAGQGAKVVLKVRVTERNEVKGTASVYAAKGNVVAQEWPVNISFPPAQVPDLATLETDFRKLEDDRSETLIGSHDAEVRTALAGKGKKLSLKIERLLAEPGADRQEVHRALRDLDRLVHPPCHDMDPPRAAFEDLVLRCKELLGGQAASPQTEAFTRTVERYDREGKDAFIRKDQRKWSILHEGLYALFQKLKPQESKAHEQELPETPFLKDQGWMRIEEVRGILERARRTRMEDDPLRYESQFKELCDKLAERLRQLEERVDSIADDMPKQQAYSKIMLALRELRAVEKEAHNVKLGVHIGRA